jgi:hypothetical protein
LYTKSSQLPQLTIFTPTPIKTSEGYLFLVEFFLAIDAETNAGDGLASGFWNGITTFFTMR